MTQQTKSSNRDSAVSVEVAQLHKRVRILTLLSVVILVALVANTAPRLVSTARASGAGKEVLRIGGIELVDKQGKQRGLWGVAPDGSVMLSLNDSNEEPRLLLMVEKQGDTTITMANRDGIPRGGWTTAANGESEIALYDGKGTARIGIKTSDNASAILLNDSQGRTRTLWSVIDAGAVKKAELGFYDIEAKRRLALMSVSDGTPAVVFLDPSDPASAVGGWYARGETVAAIPKGKLPATLGR